MRGAIVVPDVHAFHGDQDRTVDYHQGSRSVGDLRRLGYAADFRIHHGAGHDFGSQKNDVFRGLEKAVQRASGSVPRSTVAGKRTASL